MSHTARAGRTTHRRPPQTPLEKAEATRLVGLAFLVTAVIGLLCGLGLYLAGVTSGPLLLALNGPTWMLVSGTASYLVGRRDVRRLRRGSDAD